jgi:hypothetical protein
MINILLANATTFQERREIIALSEADTFAVNNAMVTDLYKSALEKGHVDFEDIPVSRGDITKYSGYKSMTDTLALLTDIATKSSMKIKEIGTIETAINNIISFRDHFTKGFALEKQFIIVLYNSLVYACVEATSLIISSYVDYVKRPDKVEFELISIKHGPNSVCINNLEAFNKAVKSGEANKTLHYIINSEKQSIVGVDDVIVPALIIGGLVLIVPVIRELIFYFYYSRMKVSDYLKQQAALLELNKAMVEVNASLTQKQKQEILQKQQERIQMLKSMSEKIQVNHSVAQTKTLSDEKEENKSWKLNDIMASKSHSDTGVQIL